MVRKGWTVDTKVKKDTHANWHFCLHIACLVPFGSRYRNAYSKKHNFVIFEGTDLFSYYEHLIPIILEIQLCDQDVWKYKLFIEMILWESNPLSLCRNISINSLHHHICTSISIKKTSIHCFLQNDVCHNKQQCCHTFTRCVWCYLIYFDTAIHLFLIRISQHMPHNPVHKSGLFSSKRHLIRTYIYQISSKITY